MAKKSSSVGSARRSVKSERTGGAHGAEVAEGLSIEPASFEESEDLLDVLLGSVPALEDTHRALYERQQPAARATEIGKRTSAVGFIPAAIKLYTQIEQAAEGAPERFRPFSPALRRWFMEQLVGLRAAVARRDRRAEGAGGVSTAVALAMSPARAARNALLAAIALAIEGDVEAEMQLAQRRGTSDSLRAMLLSLRALADLGDSLRKRKGAIEQLAAAEAGLDASLVRDVRAAAKALQRALDDDARIGRKQRGDQDTVEMNLFEGRATLTLRRMRAIYNIARHADPTLAPLVTPPALSGVFPAAGRTSSKPEETPPTPEA